MLRLMFLSCFILWAGLIARTQNIDVQHYTFSIELRDQTDMIKGNAIVHLKALKKLSSFDLDLSSVKNDKGMKVQTVVQCGNTNDKLRFVHKSDLLTIMLKDSIEINEERRISISYQGIPADGLVISKNKFGERTFFSDNWPNRARHWIPCNDRPDDKASFEFIVSAPSHYKVISNGVLKEEKEMAKGMRQSHWSETIPQPTKVMVIGAARFAVKTFHDSPEDIPVSAWVYPQDSAKGFYDYALAPSILKFFSEYLAPYPYQKLANVQSKTIFGGMENASAIFYSETSVTGDRESEDLIAHEVAHQWFGNMASEKSFTHLWLSEGFATYLTNIYLEEKYGREKLIDRLEEDRKKIIEFSLKHEHPVVDSACSYMELLNANSYQKGGWVLHMLRNEVGDKTFREILQKYYNQYKGANAGTRDFERVAEEVSGGELTWFFDQWLYRPGIPELKMESKIQDGYWYIYITQKGEPYRFFLEFDIVEEDGGLIRERFEVKEKESVFKVPVKGNEIKFSIDPQVKLLYRLAD